MYRFDNFLEEARNLIKKSQASVYFHLLFIRKHVWQDLKDIMEEFSSDGRRNWKAKLIATQQDDFYILQFTKKNDDSEARYFFWKVIPQEDELVILSFSLEKFQFVRSCLRSFIESADIDFPWIGSVFLENLDDFIQVAFGADARLDYKRIIYDSEPIAGKGEIETDLRFAVASKEDILKRKQNEYEQYHRFLYIRRVRASVHSKGTPFLFSISDEAEILLEKGDLLTFLEIISALRSIVSFYRKSARKHLEIGVKEIMTENGKTTELRTIQNLEVLKIEIKNPMTQNWYENLTELFSQPYKSEEKLMSFVLMKGNPYFLAQVIDLEKGGSGLYLSATENSVRISPSSTITKSVTVLKIIKTLQKYVDPNITIFGA